MALTSAQKMKDYRQRLKEKGDKKIEAIIPCDIAESLEGFRDINYPGLSMGQAISKIIISVCKRNQNERGQIAILKHLNASDETIKGYIDFLRWEFEDGLVITAEKYLEMSSETERLSDEYLAKQTPSNK
ncbi:MAG: hypothetical protein Q8S55_10420 [Methylococcaceae bacterium]|nr:hypothetical protein [Methylococcaceae bacterium]